MSTDLSNAAPLLDYMEDHASKPSVITQQQAGCTLPLHSHCFSLFHATFEIQCGKACRCEDAWLVYCRSIEFRSTPEDASTRILIELFEDNKTIPTPIGGIVGLNYSLNFMEKACDGMEPPCLCGGELCSKHL